VAGRLAPAVDSRNYEQIPVRCSFFLSSSFLIGNGRACFTFLLT
jgi:hypothetical protein